jgi:hypothetical protein
LPGQQRHRQHRSQAGPGGRTDEFGPFVRGGQVVHHHCLLPLDAVPAGAALQQFLQPLDRNDRLRIGVDEPQPAIVDQHHACAVHAQTARCGPAQLAQDARDAELSVPPADQFGQRRHQGLIE